MARFLALEWDETEARVAVANARGDQVVFEQAFSVALEPGQTEGEQVRTTVGEQIGAALAARRIGHVDTLVAVGRSSVELRRMSLPPAPDDELPDMVRFQAVREFNVLEEDWPLDFLPIDDDPQQPRNVLAATIRPELVEEIRHTCEAAGLKPARLVLRPAAAASLLCRRRPPEPGEVRLLVDPSLDEADLTAMIGRKVVYQRRARLPGDPLAAASAADALVSEVRRTMAAVHNQLGGRRVQSIVLCGAGPQPAAIVESIRSQLSASAELFDPFDGLPMEGPLRRKSPDRPGRFAPLLGMLWDELEQTPHAFDFLNPRRRPKPPSRRNTYVAAGLAAALVVLALPLSSWLEGSWLKGDIDKLSAASKDLDQKIEQVAKLERAAEEIEEWMSAEVVWLDELRWLSQEFPEAQDAMLAQLTLAVNAAGRGEMILDGLARDVDAVNRLDRGLRDESHRVAGKAKSEDRSRAHYSVHFRSSLLISPEEP